MSEHHRRSRVQAIGFVIAALWAAVALSSPAAAATPTEVDGVGDRLRELASAVDALAADLARAPQPLPVLARHERELDSRLTATRAEVGSLAQAVAQRRVAPHEAAAALATPHLALLRSLRGVSIAAPALPNLPAPPPPPEQLQPVLGVAAPVLDETVGRVCGLTKLGLSLGGGLAPTIVAQFLPVPGLDTALKPPVQAGVGILTQVLNLACGSIPVRQLRTTCTGDGQIAAVLPATWPEALGFLGGVLGSPRTLLPAPVGVVVDTVAAAERAGGQGPTASAALAEQLECTTVDRFEGGSYDLGQVDLGGEEAPTADAIAFGGGDVVTVDAITTALGGTDLAGGDRSDVALGDLRPELRTTGNDRPADRPWQRLVLMCAGLVALGGLLLGPGARSLLS